MADRIPTGANTPSAAACAQDFSSSSPLSDRSPRSLALDVDDNAGDLRTTLQAYCAIEKLMSCHGAQDSQTIVANRDEMGALLRLMNDRFAQHLDTLDSTLRALHSGLHMRETLQ